MSGNAQEAMQRQQRAEQKLAVVQAQCKAAEDAVAEVKREKADLINGHIDQMAKLQQKVVDAATEIGMAKAKAEAAEKAVAAAETKLEKAKAAPSVVGGNGDGGGEGGGDLELRRERDRLQGEANSLQGEVLELRRQAAIPQSPSMAQYHGLATQVQAIQERAEAREAELQRVMAEARQNSKVQVQRLHSLHQVGVRGPRTNVPSPPTTHHSPLITQQEELEAKEQQIRMFRKELDDLLTIMGKLSDRHPAISDVLMGASVGAGSE